MAPYPPQTWALGGRPSVGVDIPITAVFLALYICGAVTHMTLFQINKKRGHKFIFSGAIFVGFCMARTVTCIMRISSISLPHNVPLLIAANIFTAAGVVIIYIVNIVFAQRIIRAHHPTAGWHQCLRLFFVAIYVIVILTLIMLITSVVQSYYTLSTNTHRIDRDIMHYGVTMFAIISFLPILFLTVSLLIPRNHHKAVDKFGAGRFRTKIAVLYIASALVCAGASWRAGTSWVDPVRRTQPIPWYFQKAWFYIFDFGVEICVIYLYAFFRIDLRFYVPDGARGAGSYSASGGERGRGLRVFTEEETFDGDDRFEHVKAGKAVDRDLESKPPDPSINGLQ